MKTLSLFFLAVLLGIAGCTMRRATSDTAAEQTSKAESRPLAGLVKEQQAKQTDSYSFDQAAKAMSIEAAIDRKIIRDADLTIEVNSTTEAQQKVTAIAEAHGGFVVTSEAKQRENVDPAKRTVDVKLVVRVPSNQFGAALDQIEKLAMNLPQRNVSGQDVTEEFIDLEARIKTQKALELQFLEIMKQANNVADALEVQRQIADVRTEIEKLEGRKRFLESKSSLSTITVNIQSPIPIVVSASGFGHTVREAVSESLELASAIVLFFVRFVIVMIPVFVFLILPVGLLGLYFRRRARRFRLAEQLATNPVTD
jgi:ribosomal protein L29